MIIYFYHRIPNRRQLSENDNKSDADNGIKRKTVGVGIGNIAYRIKGMYNNSGIKIYSVKDRGTVIQIFFDNYSK